MLIRYRDNDQGIWIMMHHSLTKSKSKIELGIRLAQSWKHVRNTVQVGMYALLYRYVCTRYCTCTGWYVRTTVQVSEYLHGGVYSSGVMKVGVPAGFHENENEK